MLELIAFFGNPGTEYVHNRHNAGWLLADALPFLSAVHWQKKHKGLYTCIDGTTDIPSKIHFLKPETYMNSSGASVQSAASFFKIPIERVLVIHDELDLALGEVSLKFSGGLNGHNGLRSMKAAFDNADFWRLRIGIGRPDNGDVYNWVLSDFSKTEMPILEQTFALCADVLTKALINGPEILLPEWSKKKAGNYQ
jgi:PTH1 family peptidyl-tRNA hydrolase